MFIGDDATYRDDLLVKRGTSGLADCEDSSVTTSAPSGVVTIIVASVAVLSILTGAYSLAVGQSAYYEPPQLATHDTASSAHSHHEGSELQELDELVASFRDYAVDLGLPLDDIVDRAASSFERRPILTSDVSASALELALDDIRSLADDESTD